MLYVTEFSFKKVDITQVIILFMFIITQISNKLNLFKTFYFTGISTSHFIFRIYLLLKE